MGIYVVAQNGTAANRAAAVYDGTNHLSASKCMSPTYFNGLTGGEALQPGDIVYFSSLNGNSPYIQTKITIPQSGNSSAPIPAHKLDVGILVAEYLPGYYQRWLHRHGL